MEVGLMVRLILKILVSLLFIIDGVAALTDYVNLPLAGFYLLAGILYFYWVVRAAARGISKKV